MLNIYVLDGKRLGFISKNGEIKSNPREAYNFRNSSSKPLNNIIRKLKASGYKYGILRGMRSSTTDKFIERHSNYYCAVVNKAREEGLVVIPFIPIQDKKDQLYIAVINIRAMYARNFIIAGTGVLVDLEDNSRYKILLPGSEANKELSRLFNKIRNI